MGEWRYADQSARSLMPSAISIGPKRMSKRGERRKKRLIKSRRFRWIHIYIYSRHCHKAQPRGINSRFAALICWRFSPGQETSLIKSSCTDDGEDDEVMRVEIIPFMSVGTPCNRKHCFVVMPGSCSRVLTYVCTVDLPTRIPFTNSPHPNDFVRPPGGFTL